MILSLRLLAATVAAALLTSACTTAVVVVPLEPAIVVEPAGHVLLLRSSDERRRLAAFLVRASDGRLDAIHVTVVAAHPGVRQAVVRAVRAIGVAPSKIREVHGMADAGARYSARVEAVRYHAYPPPCPPLYVVGPAADANDFDPMLGCSDLANLALQVNDPKDLVANPVVAPADGERAAIPVARYRQFAGPQGGSGSSNATAGAPAQ